MGAPLVSIDVDERTGRWSTDSLPMLYVPVHFFVNNHRAIERELGVERYSELLYDAGYKSAWEWCEHEAREHHLSGAAVFHHYMRRLSQRGWAQFEVLAFDLEVGTASVAVRHSVFAPQAGEEGTGDYMFTGWFAGSMDQILSDLGKATRTRAEQVFREGQDGAAYGLFRVVPV
jgi:hypothetical protein